MSRRTDAPRPAAVRHPVVSSNAGGLPEVNIHGQTGLLSDVGDVEQMAKNALEILSNEETLQKFRANALEQAKRFDIKNILPQYEAYYEEVLKTAVYTTSETEY